MIDPTVAPYNQVEERNYIEVKVEGDYDFESIPVGDQKKVQKTLCGAFNIMF